LRGLFFVVNVYLGLTVATITVLLQ